MPQYRRQLSPEDIDRLRARRAARRAAIAPPPEPEPSFWDRIGGLPGVAATGTRAITGVMAAPGQGFGAAMAGGGELLAQLFEGSLLNPEIPLETKLARAGVEAGLGAVPFGKVFKIGKGVESAVRGGLYSGIGEAGRELARGEDLDPTSVALHTGGGAALGGGLARLLRGPAQVAPKAEPRYEYRPAPMVRPTGEPVTSVPATVPMTEKSVDLSAEAVPKFRESLRGTLGNRLGRVITEADRTDRTAMKEMQAALTASDKEEAGLDLLGRRQDALTRKGRERSSLLRLLEQAKEGRVPTEPKVGQSVSAPGGNRISRSFVRPKEDDDAEILDDLISPTPQPTAAPVAQTTPPLPKNWKRLMQDAGVPTSQVVATSRELADPRLAKDTESAIRQFLGLDKPAQAAISAVKAKMPAVAAAKATPTPRGKPLLTTVGAQEEEDFDLLAPFLGGARVNAAPGLVEPFVSGIKGENTLGRLYESFFSKEKRLDPSIPGMKRPTGVFNALGDLLRTEAKEAGLPTGKAAVRPPGASTMAPEPTPGPSLGVLTDKPGAPRLVKTPGAAPVMPKPQTPEPRPVTPEAPEPTVTPEDWVREGLQEVEKYTGLNKQFKKIIADESGVGRAEIMTGIAGAGLGGLLDPFGDPVISAIAGGVAGAALPRLITKVMSTTPVPPIPDPEAAQTLEIAQNPEAFTKAFNTIAETIPQYLRASLLMSRNILSNAVVAPWASGVLGALEMHLMGDPRGMLLMKAMHPGKWLNRWKSNFVEADKIAQSADVAETERVGGALPKGVLGQYIRLPGTYIISGDMTTRQVVQSAGLSEEFARAITVTREPETKAGTALLNMQRTGGPVMQTAMPFAKTLINLTEEGAKRTPGVGSLYQLLVKGANRDPLKQQMIQQGIGAGIGTVAAGVGALEGEIDDPLTQKFVRGLVSNASGPYSLIATTGYGLGRGLSQGATPRQAIRQAGTTVLNETPLPSTEIPASYWNWATAEPGSDPRLPAGIVPGMARDLYDIFNPKKQSRTSAGSTPRTRRERQRR